MAFSASTIIETVGEQLNDTSPSLWTGAMICKHVTEAQNLIVSLRNDAKVTVDESFSFAATMKQTIPSGGVRLLGVVTNASGIPIKEITRDQLTQIVPTWTTDTGTAIEFFMFDVYNPKIFWVYPTPTSPFNGTIIYSDAPDDFTTGSSDIDIAPLYITPIYEWVLYRCFSMETKGMDIPLANEHLNNFLNIMGIKKNNDVLLQQIKAVDR